MARRKRSHRRGRRRNSPRRRHRAAAVSVRRRRRNSPRRHRGRARGRRRNPPFAIGGGRGLIGQLTAGFVDAGEVLVGEAATNIIASYIPVTGPALQAAAKVGAAVLVAWAGKRVSSNFAKMALAGGLASVIRGPIKAANLPLVSAALGDADYYAVGAYPTAPALNAYPQAYAGVGDDDDAFVQY